MKMFKSKAFIVTLFVLVIGFVAGIVNSSEVKAAQWTDETTSIGWFYDVTGSNATIYYMMGDRN